MSNFVMFVVVVIGFILLFLVLKKIVAVSGGFDVPKRYLYKLKNFLSPAERSFYGVLLRVVGDQQYVFAKVRIADVLTPAMLRGKNRSEWQKVFNSISAKHFDFVVCDLKTVKAQYIVELDDSSHQSQSAKLKDHFKNDICKAAGLPLIRIRASHTYSTELIKDQIDKVILSERVPVDKENDQVDKIVLSERVSMDKESTGL